MDEFERAAQKQKVILDLCQRDFYFFTRYMFKQRRRATWQHAPHHQIICDAMMRVFDGEVKNLIINVPPRYSKTEIAAVNFIAWAMGKVPDAEFIHASYSSDLAANNAMHAKELMLNPAYQSIFPGVQLRKDLTARDHWGTTVGGVVHARSSGQPITGFGAGKFGRETFGGCFPYAQLVETEHGPRQIGDIVTSATELRVWSFNETTGQKELRRVVRRWRNPANHLIEISGGGKSFRCTPDHEILTEAGWVAAIHLAKSLDLMQGQSGEAASLGAGQARVDGDLHDAFRVLWLCVPRGVRKALRDGCPSLAHFDLSDDADADTVTAGQITRAFGALEDGRRMFARELGAGASLENREGSVAQRVLHVVGLCAIREIGERIIRGVAVEVPDLMAVGSWAYELIGDEVRDVAHRHFAANRQIDTEIALAVSRRLNRSQGECPSDLAKVGHLVEPVGSGHWAPDRVRYVGHVDETFCLEVEANHNFILAESGAIVSNCIIVDDPHKANDADSDSKRPAVIRWFQNTLESRRNDPERTPIIVIMQRLHEEDLAGWLLDGGNGEEWEHICLPALREDGTALWPQKHTVERLRRMEEASPYTFAGQYQQVPVPAGGGLFKADRIEAIDAVPAETPIVRTMRAWDLAGSKDGDYTVGALFGEAANKQVFILDVSRIRGGPDEVEAMICRTAQRDGPRTRISLPKDPGQAGVHQSQYLIRKLQGYPVTATPETGDKVTRAEPLASQVNVGNIKMLRGEWGAGLIHELRNFPFGKYDDQVDACSRAFNELVLAGGAMRVKPLRI